MRRPPVALALPVLALVLAACGSDGGSSGPTTVPPAADVVITAVEGIRWDKDAYTATSTNAQLVIQGRNESSLGHNLYVVGADGKQVAEHEDRQEGRQRDRDVRRRTRHLHGDLQDPRPCRDEVDPDRQLTEHALAGAYVDGRHAMRAWVRCTHAGG